MTVQKNGVYDPRRGDKFIFLSYAHEDGEKLKADIELMSNFGVRLWYDTSLEYGDSWKKQVLDVMTMDNCIGLCCYLGEDSVASGAVCWEIETAIAIKSGKPKFGIYSVNEDGRSVFDLLRAAEKNIPESSRERHYRLFLQAFDKESVFFSRSSDPTDKAHIYAVVDQFEKDGARDTNVNYSAPEEFVYVPYRDGIKITGYRGKASYPNIPAEIAGKRVLALGMGLFAESALLRSVTLPEGVEEIGDRCFADCKKLEKVNLPVSVRRVAYEAFRGCTELRTMTFHKHVKEVGDYCFYLCKNLTDVTFDAGCRDVTLGFNCFQECENLTLVVMPTSVAYLPMYCFNKCESLERIRMPEHIAAMAETVVHNCPKLSSLVFPGGFPEGYDGRAVMHCAALEEFVCTGELPAAAADAIAATGARVRRILPAPSPEFDESDMTVYFRAVPGASGYTAEISEKSNAGSAAEEYAAECVSVTRGGKKMLAFSVRTVSENGKTHIVPSADNSGARDCPSFTFRLRADGSGGYADSEYSAELLFRNGDKDFIASEDDPAELKAYNGSDEDVVVPDRFTRIGKGAFRFNDVMRTVTLPCKIEEIGEEAFYHCTRLEKINWDLEGDLKKIGAHAFAYCKVLGDLTFPRALYEIGKGAFEVCPSITEADMSRSFVGVIETLAFRRCINLKHVRYSVNINAIRDKAFRGCTSLLPGTLPSGLRSIGAAAFSFLMDAEEIVLPAAVREIAGDFLFYSTGIRRIRFDGEPKNYKTVDETLLTADGKTAVTFPINADVRDYVLPDGVERIGGFAFRDMENMRSAALCDSLTEIDEENFSFCWDIERIVLGKNVTKIGRGCFSHNPVLKEIVITSDALPEADEGCFEKNSDDLVIVFGGAGYSGKTGNLSAWEYLKSKQSRKEQ